MMEEWMEWERERESEEGWKDGKMEGWTIRFK
jgi:hypothetical protein